MNKTLKFRPELTSLITGGTKTATWRLDDDKNIMVGDTLELLEFGTLNKIATAVAQEVIVKKFKDLTDNDRLGHELYSSENEMYKSFSNDYKKVVDPETEVKVIKFRILELH
jgi:hypothetical protein